MAAFNEWGVMVLRPVQIVLNAAAGMRLQLLCGLTGTDAVATSDQTDPDWMQIPASEASLIPPCTDQNPSEPRGKKWGENKEILHFCAWIETIFDNFPSALW